MIEWQAARKNAVEIVCAALSNDGLKLGNAGNAKKLDLLCDFVDEITKRELEKKQEYKDELEANA